MKGDPKILAALNTRLAEELTAISQYVVHAGMFDRWGYDHLAGHVMAGAKTEMGHADKLIDRILFLEGKPEPKLNDIKIGSDPKAMLTNDLAAEHDAVAKYNESVRLAVDANDDGSRLLFESILKDEESHVLWYEQQLQQIAQMQLDNYLGMQTGGG